MERGFVLILLLHPLVTLDLAAATPCTVTATGAAGECKLMTDCPVVLQEYTKMKKTPTICDPKYRTVCCPIQMKAAAKLTTTSTTPAPTKRISEKKCGEYGQYVYHIEKVDNTIRGEAPIINKKSLCVRDSAPLIVGGEEAKEREFPHMALIGFGEGNPEDYNCGGSLISEEWILSAAHCAKSRMGPAAHAKLGNIRRDASLDEAWHYTIVERISHPNYSSRFAEDDIALFKLNEPATLNKFVIPICLPQLASLDTKKAIATGWGRTGLGEGSADVLMKVTLDYAEQQRCDAVYANDAKLQGKPIDWSKMVCAGSTNKTGDTCAGDSGGPLQIFNNNVHCMYTIVGVTSYGPAYCGASGIPAIYTKVYHYLDWIESIVWPSA